MGLANITDVTNFVRLYYLDCWILVMMGSQRSLYVFVIGSTTLALYLILCRISNSITLLVNQPYMDEKFHIPQAQKYCEGNFFSYDPKITTPPGLYVLTYFRLYIRDVLILKKNQPTCDVIDLRRTNQLVAVLTYITLVMIQLSFINDRNFDSTKRKIGFLERVTRTVDRSPKLHLAKIVMTSMAITSLPPLFSFHTLYYTDAGSLLFILLTYLFSVNDKHLISAIFGLVSISFRQTNIVWVFYTACLVIIKIVAEFLLVQKTALSKMEGDKGKQKISSTYRTRELKMILHPALIKKLIKICWPYALVGISFVAFVFINKGLALGDKEAHQPKLHLAQMLYFLGFCATFGASWIFRKKSIKLAIYYIFRRPVTMLLAASLISFIIYIGRYAHPYLLADNRHLTFYLWRRLLGHNSYAPYLITPIYLMASLSINQHLRQKGYMKMGLLVFCTMLSIIPNGLLEPRYFIIPFVFLRLNIESSLLEHVIELLQHVAVNLSMYYLFLFKTFRWADSNEEQRITW